MSQSTVNSQEFSLISSQTLSDYVTAVAWTPQGTNLAATSAAGEVVFCQNNGELVTLQSANGESVDCVAFSQDGNFLAVSGQNGQVKIWQGNELITTLDGFGWVDKLAWSPTSNHLAFSSRRKVQVWDANSKSLVVNLDFDNSSALGIDWRNDGNYLAISGHRGVKVWNTQSWNDEPYILDVPSTSLAMAWSADGRYLASGNMDKTIAVVESELLLSGDDPRPWIMHGFPGKVRQVAWSEINSDAGAPLLACSSMDGIVLWEKQPGEDSDWEGEVLTNHAGIIQAINFAPQSFLLASAASDGWLCLWQNAQEVSQIITGVKDGFTCMDWHPQGHKIAAGGDNGELLVWGNG
ncbi:WD-40 repeat-containing protein [Calothrix parasitica NIES-267]|uniref:WD-40 repeat-containing protein n=1 Tax=Calothrix parasitica NIES-267 TaxID=1973488 RepID=A0A1Z4LZ86_9CYAN|nr:WD-40 repeat-containing protein [Calothrix parasitica NIES-267]